MPKSAKPPEPLPETLSSFTRDLIEDLHALRAGKISLGEARVRAQLAREVLRSVHIQFQGLRALAAQATPIGPPKGGGE